MLNVLKHFSYIFFIKILLSNMLLTYNAISEFNFLWGSVCEVFHEININLLADVLRIFQFLGQNGKKNAMKFREKFLYRNCVYILIRSSDKKPTSIF